MRSQRVLHRSSVWARALVGGALFISCARALDDHDVGRNLFANPGPDAAVGGEVNTAGDSAGGANTGGTGGMPSGGTATGGSGGGGAGGVAPDEPDAGMDPVDGGMDDGGAAGMAGGGAAGMAGGGTSGGGNAGMAGGGTAGGGTSGGGNGGGGSGPNPVRLEAESASLTGCTVEGGGDSGNKVINFEQGDSICWPGVDMNGITMVTIHHGNGETLGDMLAVAYGANGLGQVAVVYTAGWSSPMLDDVSITFAAQTGVGQLCLTGTGTGWIASVDYVDLD